MNISKHEMSALRAALSKHDKEAIAHFTNKSPRTVEAVLNYARQNDDIEIAIVRFATARADTLSNVLQTVKFTNKMTIPVTADQLKQKKAHPSWTDNKYYCRHIDAYLQLSHLNLDADGIWENIIQDFNELFDEPVYVAALVQRLLGISEDEAVKIYKQNI
jgi:hypothetical protein